MGGEAVAAKVLANQPRRVPGPIVEREVSRADLEGHPDSPSAGGREAVQESPERTRPFGEDDRTEVAVHPHRRVVERPGPGGPGAFASWHVRDEGVRGPLRNGDDRARKPHGGRHGGGARYPFVLRGPRPSSASQSCTATGCGSPS